MTEPALPPILVVDDNQDNAEIIRQYLEIRGYPITVAHNGDEALVAFDENGILWVAGQLGEPGGSVADQTRQALAAIDAIGIDVVLEHLVAQEADVGGLAVADAVARDARRAAPAQLERRAYRIVIRRVSPAGP